MGDAPGTESTHLVEGAAPAVAEVAGQSSPGEARFGLLVSALAAVFGTALVTGGPDAAYDRVVLLHAQVDALVPAARVVTRLGDWWAVLLLGACAGAWAALRGHLRAALLLIVLLVSQRALVELLKSLFGRDRPDPAGHLDAVHSMAFPSGHSANAMTLALGLVLLLPPARNRLPVMLLALLLAFLVGASRLVLGVHWPSDVAGGWALGALWTLLLVRLAAGTSPPRPH